MIRLLIVLGVSFLADNAWSTSIVFPAFGRPIVLDGKAFFSETDGSNVVCFDLAKRVRKWRTGLNQRIRSLSMDAEGNLLAADVGRMAIISSETGTLIGQQKVPGVIFGTGPSKIIFCHNWKKKEIHCYSYAPKKTIWTFKVDRHSNPEAVFHGTWVFVFVSPRSITFSNEENPTFQGRNEVVCLRSSDGSIVWREGVPLSRKGSGVRGSVKEKGEILLLNTDRFLQLLDRSTGRKLRRYESDLAIDDAAFWGEEKIAVCLGSVGAQSRTMRILSLKDLAPIFEFDFSAREVSSIYSVGDILVTTSLYRNHGLDLRERKQVWESFQRWETASNGQMFFGTGEMENGRAKRRIFGECDPKTGATKTLYAEESMKSPSY